MSWIVIDSNIRSQGLGKELIKKLRDIAIEKGCYKVILNCKDDKVGFYEKCGFLKKDNGMKIYFY